MECGGVPSAAWAGRGSGTGRKRNVEKAQEGKEGLRRGGGRSEGTYTNGGS